MTPTHHPPLPRLPSGSGRPLPGPPRPEPSARLFEATLEVHRTMGSKEVSSALSEAASSLLRCPEVEVSTSPPQRKEGMMAVAMTAGTSPPLARR